MIVNAPKFKFLVTYKDGKKLVYSGDGYVVKDDGSLMFFTTFKEKDGDKNKAIFISAINRNDWTSCDLLSGQKIMFSPEDFNNYNSEQEEFAIKDNKFSYGIEGSDDDENEEKPEGHVVQNNIDNKKTSENNNNDEDDDEDEEGENDILAMMNDAMGNGNNNSKKEEVDKEKLKETLIIDYVNKINLGDSIFDIEVAVPQIQRKGKESGIEEVGESDILWIVSKEMFKNKYLLRKFSTKEVQKELDLVLPDVIKRFWNGSNLSYIHEVLQNKETVRNASYIDLAVWITKNNFQTN